MHSAYSGRIEISQHLRIYALTPPEHFLTHFEHVFAWVMSHRRLLPF